MMMNGVEGLDCDGAASNLNKPSEFHTRTRARFQPNLFLSGWQDSQHSEFVPGRVDGAANLRDANGTYKARAPLLAGPTRARFSL